MPILSGMKGKAFVLGERIGGPPQARGQGNMRMWRSPPLASTNPVITGVTKDSSGSALGNCVVQLFRTLDDQFMFETTSDGSGNFSVHAIGGGPFYLVAYKPGSPDVAGTTLNTVQADG